jgi:hypothetical protein
MVTTEAIMSEWKRSHHEYAASARSAPVRPAPLPRAEARPELGIDESQPRPTLEMARALALLTESDASGGDPYNAVGRHIGARRAG